jgi:hypothetical protein
MSNRLNTDNVWANLGGSGGWNRPAGLRQNGDYCGNQKFQEIPAGFAQDREKWEFRAAFPLDNQEAENRLKSSGAMVPAGGIEPTA